MHRSNWLEAMQNLAYLTQFGLSVAEPIVLCLWGAHWLQQRFVLGSWVMLLGLVLGLGSAASSFLSFLRYFQRRTNKKPPNGK